MSRRRRLAALVLLAGVASLGGAGFRAAGAQSIALTLSPFPADSTSPAPVITVNATVPPDFGPFSIQVILATDRLFSAPFLVRSTTNLTTQFTVDSLLPEHATIFFRARLFDRFNTAVAETTFSYPVRGWLRLVSPVRSTDVLFTRTPRFEWDSPPITLPPGPWKYVVTVVNTGMGTTAFQSAPISATSFVFPAPLDACTSYKWNVVAFAENGGSDQVVVNSPGTFVIQTEECPQVTSLYNNFPNPFGRGLSATTCIWFDLAHRTTVKLAIYDLRGRQVKGLIPGALPAVLDSGAHGRAATTEKGGCDARLLWDGRDDNGRQVPAGVYVVVLEADGKRGTVKMLYKGP